MTDKVQAGTAYQDMGMVVTNPFGGYIEPRTFKDKTHLKMSDIIESKSKAQKQAAKTQLEQDISVK